ncbi:MAG: hypothetical protein P4L46_22325 [Fimbriimonas sp.]|nr:hypothetical protein [Fimbriimonas sp.]
MFLRALVVPSWALPIANVAMCEVFLGIPLLALCYAAKDRWSPKLAVAFLISGLCIQAPTIYVSNHVFHHPGLVPDMVAAVGQIGLLTWCVGLGALLATLIKDQNLLVPIAIFLACLDMFLVFSPLGTTHVVLNRLPGVLPAVGLHIPVARTFDSGRRRVDSDLVAGPADFMFLAMFMISLFRFNLKGKRTVMVVVPVLLIYMILVGLFHWSLPALLPIGACVLLVNWKEFNLTRDEQLSTALIALIGVGLVTWGMFQKPKLVVQPEPSQPAVVQGLPAR